MSGKELIICFSVTKATLKNCVLNLTAVRRLELLQPTITMSLDVCTRTCFFNNDILYMVDQITYDTGKAVEV